MRLSAATSVFVNYPLEAAVDEVMRAGFSGIDLWCGRPHLFRRDHPEEKLMQLRRKMEATGLTVVSVMPAFFRYPFSLSSPVDEIYSDTMDYMTECIDHAARIGAQHVLVVPTNLLQGQNRENARRTFLSSLATLCDCAEGRGVKLGIEVVYSRLSPYMGHTRQAIEVIRELQSDSVGIVLDTGHLNLSGEGFRAALDAVGEYLFQVHVNDNNGLEQQNAIPGDGTFDFATMVDLLRQRNYHGFLTVELGWHYSFDPCPAVTEAHQRMQRYMDSRPAAREGS